MRAVRLGMGGGARWIADWAGLGSTVRLLIVSSPASWLTQLLSAGALGPPERCTVAAPAQPGRGAPQPSPPALAKHSQHQRRP